MRRLRLPFRHFPVNVKCRRFARLRGLASYGWLTTPIENVLPLAGRTEMTPAPGPSLTGPSSERTRTDEPQDLSGVPEQSKALMLTNRALRSSAVNDSVIRTSVGIGIELEGAFEVAAARRDVGRIEAAADARARAAGRQNVATVSAVERPGRKRMRIGAM